jgi:DNA-binding NarL/FixJ family response regulator
MLEPLTRRELDVARVVAEGWSSDVVGERLGIKRRTVERHLESIYDKLGVLGDVNVMRRVVLARWYINRSTAAPAAVSHRWYF